MQPAPSLGIGLGVVLLLGCATTAVRPLSAEQEVLLEGTVSSVDATPWTYDGDALVVVASVAHGVVTVHLPARWNLCKAMPPPELSTLKPGDRVLAEGTAAGPAEIRVCAQSRHRLQRAP